MEFKSFNSIPRAMLKGVRFLSLIKSEGIPTPNKQNVRRSYSEFLARKL